jgi:hypothetical protein
VKKNIFILSLFVIPFFSNGQIIQPTVYFGIWGHNCIGHLLGTRNDFFAVNSETSLEKKNLFIHPFLSVGYGFCKSNTPNNLNYFPLGAGLGFGKKRFRVKLEYYYTPIYGTYKYIRVNIDNQFPGPLGVSKEYKFNYSQTCEILLSWQTKFGLYFQGGFAYKWMRSGFLPGVTHSSYLDEEYNFIIAIPSIGIGYTFGKREKKNTTSTSPPSTANWR